MSTRTEGAVALACVAVGGIIYMGCGAIFAHLMGLNESTLAWWAMVVAWPIILLTLAVVGWAIFTIAYLSVAVLAAAIGRR